MIKYRLIGSEVIHLPRKTNQSCVFGGRRNRATCASSPYTRWQSWNWSRRRRHSKWRVTAMLDLRLPLPLPLNRPLSFLANLYLTERRIRIQARPGHKSRITTARGVRAANTAIKWQESARAGSCSAIISSKDDRFWVPRGSSFHVRSCVRFCDRIRPRACAFSPPLSATQGRISSFRRKEKKFYKIPILIESALKVNVFIRNWPTNEPTTECWIIVFAIRCNLPRESSSMFNERNERVWSELEQWFRLVWKFNTCYIRCSNWNNHRRN